jgi:hypothetical protein
MMELPISTPMIKALPALAMMFAASVCLVAD